jgi:transglutaminase-like putative cysteine protease
MGLHSAGALAPNAPSPSPFLPRQLVTRTLAAALLGLSLAVQAAHAQAPRITERGDPSVRDDTLYRLAVKAADYPDEDAVTILDDGVVVINADGTDSRTYRTVAQVLTQDAVEGMAERTFSYDGTRQRFRLNWARVIGADGHVISAKPERDQESAAPVSESSPVYTDQKIRRITMGGVVPGVMVDYSYTIENIKPLIPGDFLGSWSVHTGQPVRRSRYVVEVPASLQPRIRETNLTFRRGERRVAGAVVYDWTTAEVPKVEPEPFMADSNGVFMSILLGGNTSWAQIARWYHGLEEGRYALTPEIEAKVAEVVKDARTLDDSLRAVHRWVAQDFRYVSLSLGIGGYQPRLPAAVLQTQYGDCKDKATLFVAVARRMGVKAYPVLLNSSGHVNRAFPSIEQFDHMIAAVERPGGGYTFLDLTSDLTPYGSVVPSYQGEFGLVVRPDGTAEEITFPLDAPSGNRRETVIVGSLGADGVFSGNLTALTTGALQYRMRSAFSSRLTPTQRRDLGRTLAQGLFDGASADSLEIFDGRDLRATPQTRVWVSGGRAASRSGETLILTLPVGNGQNDEIVAQLEAAPKPRRFPIDVAAVIGPVESVTDFRLKLPPGYRARLPQNVHATSVFGTYVAEYAQAGDELRVSKRVVGNRGIQPPSAVDTLVGWLREMAKDDARFIVLEPARP